MQGKISIEEHFSYQKPDADITRRLQHAESWAETARRLVDIHDLRINDMDENGIEYAVLSIDSPSVQAIDAPVSIISPAGPIEIADAVLGLSANSFSQHA